MKIASHAWLEIVLSKKYVCFLKQLRILKMQTDIDPDQDITQRVRLRDISVQPTWLANQN